MIKVTQETFAKIIFEGFLKEDKNMGVQADHVFCLNVSTRFEEKRH